nr:MAG TPA: hypothetical protein [Caudoviricetes sp.]
MSWSASGMSLRTCLCTKAGGSGVTPKSRGILHRLS